MWSLGALLFGHLTRNCRCSHCPGINSNYALYSDGFCASDPQHPPCRCPSVLPPLTHSHTCKVLTHISRFSLPPPAPSFPSHSATVELIWLLEHSGPIMNELTEICTFRQGKEERGGGYTYQKYFWSDTWAQTILHITFCEFLALHQKYTAVKIWLDAHSQLHKYFKYLKYSSTLKLSRYEMTFTVVL